MARDFYDKQAQIAGTIHGDEVGTPLLLLHSLALDRSMWSDEVLSLFGTGRPLIVCDVPGHGASPLGTSHTIEAMADRVALMMSGLGRASATVVGVSMGGCIAQALAIRHGDHVRGLGLVDTTSGYRDPEAWRERAAMARTQGFAAMAKFQATRWFTEDFQDRKPDELRRLLGIFSGMNIDNYQVVCEAMGAVDLTADLATIACPTVVVVGDNDYATPVGHAEIIAKNVAGASLQVIKNSSHLAIIEQPREIYRTMEHML